MTGFPQRTLNVIEAFARHMEIGHLVPANDGSVTFEFERAGRLCFTPFRNSSKVLMSLGRNQRNPQFEELKRFLELSCWDSYSGISINAGMSAAGGMVLVANIDEQDFDLQTVEQCLDRLTSLHDSWLE